MKNLKKRLVAAVLATVMALGLVPSALAAGPTFSDVPESHWAYADVETAAENGLMNGTGGGMFSPDMKVSVAQFLTLVGHVVFPDVKAEGEDWAGPYISKAQEAGMLTGTQVDVTSPEAEISRYDMAVILRGAAKQLGVSEKLAPQDEVTDYGMVPTMYADAVLSVYGMGLIKGDQAGNFNGSNTMMRAEVATVIMRLKKAAPGSSQDGTTEPTAAPEKSEESEKPSNPDAKYSYLAEAGCKPRQDYDPQAVELKQGNDLRIDGGFLTPEANRSPYSTYVYFNVGDTYQFAIREVPAGYGYTQTDVTWSSDDESVFTVDENGFVTMVGPGEAFLRASIPVIYYRDIWSTSEHSILLCVDP